MKKEVLANIKFFLLSQYYGWRSWLVYRAQAAIWSVYNISDVLYVYITITVIYSVSSGIAGWSYYQLLFLTSTATMIFSILNYTINVWSIMPTLRQGGLDTDLIRPYGRMTIFLSLQNSPAVTSTIVGAVVLLIYSGVHISISALPMLLYIIMIAVGAAALVVFATMLIMLAYHLLKSAQLAGRLLNFAQQAAQYPLSVYGLLGQLIFTLVLPIGVASYYPARAFMSGISLVGAFESLAVSAAIIVVSYLLFYKLQEYYTSGGG